MKKILSIALSIIIVFTLNVSAFATDTNERNDCILLSERNSVIMDNAVAFLKEIGSDRTLIKNGIDLLNFNDELEAIFYYLNPCGYIVASYKNGQILEYSPDDLPVYSQDVLTRKNIYYGASLSFYEKESNDNQYKNIVTQEIIRIDNLNNCISEDYVLDISNSKIETNQTENNRFQLSAPLNYVSATGYYCTVTGITNLLQYYHDYYGADVYMSNVNSASGLRSKLVSMYYIYNGPLNLGSSINQYTLNGVTYYGLQSYLNRSDVTTYTASVIGITINNVINNVQSHPVLLGIYTKGIDSSANSTDTHVVLCYGYWQTYLSKGSSNNNQVQSSLVTYYIVNNGWGSNGVYVNSTYVGIGAPFKLLRLL